MKITDAYTRFDGNIELDSLNNPNPVKIPDSHNRCVRNIEVDTINKDTINKESLILGEIVKQYILIPKRSTVAIDNIASRDNELKPNADENVDWKSKYEILNKLKETEKEGSDDIFIQRDDSYNSNKQKVDFIHAQNPESLEVSNEFIQPTTQYDYELPEKDVLASNEVAYEKKYKNTKNELHLNEKADIYDEKPIQKTNIYYDRNTANKKDSEMKTKFSDLQSGYDNQDNGPKQSNLSFRMDNANNQRLAENASDAPDNHTEGKKYIADEKHNHVFEDELKPIQTINLTDLENTITNAPQIEGDHQYPIETIQVSEFTPNDDVHLQEGVNINPEGYSMNQSHFDSSYYNPQTVGLTDTAQHYNTQDEIAVNDNTFGHTQNDDSEPTEAEAIQSEDSVHATLSNYESEPMMADDEAINKLQYSETVIASNSVVEKKPVIDTRDIDEIEAEQVDMFFPEKKPENYDQEAAGDAATLERDNYNLPDEAYTGNLAQNLNFEQNEEFDNNLGETTQQYDPSYEQQYAATYEEPPQLAQQGYGQEQEVYEQQETYAQQQEAYAQQQEAYGQQQEAYAQQQEGYEQQQQSYEQQQDYVQQPIGYEQFNQEAYDELQHQHENYEDPAHIEQQLNAEQGYEENQVQQPEEVHVPENQQDSEKMQHVSSK